jgi:serine/threonine protein kinase
VSMSGLLVQGYVHRDVKPDNVFMAGSSALLGDFSLAVGPLPGSAGSLPATPGRGPCSRVSNDSTTSLTTCNSDSLPESDAAAGSVDSESELGSVASLSTSGCSSMLTRSYTADGGCHAGGTPAYCAPEVVLAAFNSIPMSEALGPHVSRACGCRRRQAA